jgi:hypothetical protein
MAARWQMVGSGRVRCLADADVDIAVQLLECSLDLIKSGCVVELGHACPAPLWC